MTPTYRGGPPLRAVQQPLSAEERSVALPLLHTLGDAVTEALATPSTRTWEEL